MQTTIHIDTKTVSQKQSSVIAPRVVGPVASVRARRKSEHAPRALTACVSDISWCKPRRSYHRAVKSFAEVYAAYQEYLTPAQHFSPAYEIGSQEISQHCGCLSDELADCPGNAPKLDDEMIEAWGYFGWLQRY